MSDGPGSSVGIATAYGLDGPGIESRWGEIFTPVQTGPGAHPASCTMGTGSFPGVKSGRGVTLTTHSLLVPRSWKSRAIPLPTLRTTTGPVTGTLYIYLYLYIVTFVNDILFYISCHNCPMGRNSSVGIATSYGLEGLGIESRWGPDIPHTSRPALGLTQPPVQWVAGLSRG